MWTKFRSWCSQFQVGKLRIRGLGLKRPAEMQKAGLVHFGGLVGKWTKSAFCISGACYRDVQRVGREKERGVRADGDAPH